ncbi:MAG: hypothetical protein ACYC1M_17705 [Armatimonadota bacterium]
MRIGAIMIGSLLLASLAAGTQAAKENPYTAGRVNARDFIILPWGGMPDLDKTSDPWLKGFWGSTHDMDATMKDLWECGFNATGFAPISTLKYAEKYGLGVITSDNPIREKMTAEQAAEAVRKLIASAKGSRALIGVNLRDEPLPSDFPWLSFMVKAVRKADPKLLPYINLYPSTMAFPFFGCTSYGDYVDQFVKGCDPSFLSYDNYSMVEGIGFSEDQFYANLEDMRKKSLEYNLPFWNIILGNCHFTYAQPTQATINVQAFSSLAYGVRGLAYFTYYAPISGNYRLAAVDQFGKRTDTWGYIRSVNYQIHKLAPTYLKLKSVNVFHTGDRLPRLCQGIETSKYLKKADGRNLLVGEFAGPDNTPYIIVVNKSITNSTSFNVEFKDKGTIKCVNAYRGNVVDHTGENVFLAPGQGMMLFLQK